MIRRVWSSLPEFNQPVFEPVGLNVVLADRGEDSNETESTNGLGKTTLLRIVHFALGADLARDRVLSHPDLLGVTFGLDFDVGEGLVEVARNTAEPRVVRVTPSFVAGLLLDSETDQNGYVVLDVADWRVALSMRLSPDAIVQDAQGEFAPSFRELSYYLIRVGKGAFVDPQVAYGGQSGSSKRLSMSYLLGMNLHAQRDLHHKLEERDRVSKALRALEDAQDGLEQETLGDLEAERVVLEKSLAEQAARIGQFNLRDDYHDLESRLDRSDRQLHDLINENHSDRRLLEYYRQSATDLPLFDSDRPASILKEAGAIFREDALRTLDEVARFHEQVYRNRAEFLAAEVDRLITQVSQRDRQIATATAEKSKILQVLASSGALETLVELQRSTTDLKVALERIKGRIEERKRFDRRKDDLTADIGHARVVLKRDLEDRRETVDEAIGLFAEYTKALYGIAGKLGIDVGDRGYRYTFSIERQGSDGVDQMVVFCFDLTVATLRARRQDKFLTLVHDSSLFADVDPRQYGLALQLADTVSVREGFQYICCLNSGALPNDHLGSLDLAAHVRLMLTDDGEEGRLLGRKLPPRENQA